MSIDGTKLLFEGFLEKRRDTLKISWVTYWFRLQNTTLFFYTKKNGSASHLRGNYYIYTVQSVREVQRAVDSKRFMFEIIMTNGKRKLLAAETAALRQEWVGHLWQAMHLATTGVSRSSTHLEVGEQLERTNSITPIRSHSESVMESLPARPLSAPAGRIHHVIRSIASPVHLTKEIPYQNTLPACNFQHHNGDSLNSLQCSSRLSNAEGQEGDYDILPKRKSSVPSEICESSTSTEMAEGVYDIPLSYRRASENPDPTESVYDVPSSLLRKVPDHTSDFSSEEQTEDGLYWMI